METVRAVTYNLHHGIGLILAFFGMALLTACFSLFNNTWILVCSAIVSILLIVQYTLSTLYNSLQISSETSPANYSASEELANILTHGAGLVLTFVGMVFLADQANQEGSFWKLTGYVVYSTTLIFQYTFSTIYHSVRQVRLKGLMRVLDHCAIFLLIAGTYTPFFLVNLRGQWGFSLFILTWVLALAGVLFQVSSSRKWQKCSPLLYIGMGVVVLCFGFKPMVDNIASSGLILLLLGAFAYCIGVFFYRKKTLRYNHAIWHLFVLTGSALHYFALLYYCVSPI